MLKIEFIGPKSEKLSVEAKDLREALKLQRGLKNKFTPLAVKFSSGALLYYHDDVMHTFMSDEEMSMPELLQLCKCLGVYQNNKDFKTDDGTIIDKGAYWKEISTGNLILVDDDEFVESSLISEHFTKIL